MRIASGISWSVNKSEKMIEVLDEPSCSQRDAS